MRKIRNIIAYMVALAILMVVQSASAQNNLEGVWKITEDGMAGPAAVIKNPQPGFMVLTKKYCLTVAVTSNKPRPDQSLSNASDAQKVAAWTPFEAYASTYEVKGNTITFHNLVAKSPEEMKSGSMTTFDFKIEGNVLFLTLKGDQSGPDARGLKLKLTRVE